MILLDKAKSLIQLMGRRSASVAEREIPHAVSEERIRKRIATDFVDHDTDQDEISEPVSSEEVNPGRSQGLIREGNLTLDFEVEVSAEDFFVANHGKQARGTFQEVDAIRWDHDEADWSIDDLDFEPPVRSADPSPSKSDPECRQQRGLPGSHDRTLQHEEALKRLREFALRRRWLAAAAALDKASKSCATLSKRERAAIEHVLSVSGATTRYMADSEALRCVLLKTQKGVDNGDAVRRIVPDPTASKAGSRNQKPGSRKVNSEAKSYTQIELRSSVLRVRQIAAERNWLSPKSSRALVKLGDSKAALGRSEINALNYLLDRCANVSELMADVEILRKVAAK